jgi:GTPase involved in cell partitioning and DNA repair
MWFKNYPDNSREYEKIRSKMLKKPEIIALTKIEGLDDDIIEMQIKELQKKTPKTQFLLYHQVRISDC